MGGGGEKKGERKEGWYRKSEKETKKERYVEREKNGTERNREVREGEIQERKRKRKKRGTGKGGKREGDGEM